MDSSNQKVILLRFLRSFAAIAAASLAAWVITSDFLSLVPDDYDFLVVTVLAPLLLAAEKWLRDGGDVVS